MSHIEIQHFLILCPLYCLIGTAKVNKIAEPCWILTSKDEAMYVHCTGAFEYNSTLRTGAGNPVTIFSANMTVILGGHSSDPSDPNRLLAHDLRLDFVHLMYGCGLVIGQVSH